MGGESEVAKAKHSEQSSQQTKDVTDPVFAPVFLSKGLHSAMLAS